VTEPGPIECSVAETVDYSIIIPAFNEAELLPTTLRRVNEIVAEIKGYRGEVVVTDNNSADETAAIARDHGAHVVFEPVQQIARARNAGAEQSVGRFLIFIDADTLIPTELVQRSLDILASGTCCGGGALLDPTEAVGWTGAVGLRLWNILGRTFKWACGAYVFCPRDAWAAAEGFDERFFASEEIHFAQALKRWGRSRGKKFQVLPFWIKTSMRKFEWYSTGQIMRMVIGYGLRPRSLRSREGCGLWYERPEAGNREETHKD
jgi:glycosyltransferase involved in cell wall biosynthesis